MNDVQESFTERTDFRVDDLPGRLSGGSTVLVASTTDPSQYAVGLHLLSQYGASTDTAVTVTTTESVDRTVETYDRLGSDDDRPPLGIVDTTSEQQSVSALYDETPVVFTPAPGDVERLVVALSELTEQTAPASGERHLVVRSLTPILDAAPTPLVCRVLERITGLRSDGGLCLLGLDRSAHDGETMAAVAEQVDGVLRVTQAGPDRLEFAQRPGKNRYGHSAADGDIGD